MLPSRQNQTWLFSGIDSPEHCQDKQHFFQYPHRVEYCYNSRGFRDQEWPDGLLDLRRAIWCVGDSFTVGIGQPFDHIWPQVLQRELGRRCINVSMDGASNDWIYRRTRDIMTSIRPRDMIVMWSYTHRREIADPNLTDEQRVLHFSRDTVEQDTDRWITMSKQMSAAYPRVVQCTVPAFVCRITESLEQQWNKIKGHQWPSCPKTLAELEGLPICIRQELKTLHRCYDAMQRLLLQRHEIADLERTRDFPDDVIYLGQQHDYARDGHHFDILTSRWVVHQIMHHLAG